MNTEEFQQGYDIETYVSNLRNYRSLVKKLMEKARVKADDIAALRDAVGRYAQPVRATIMTEDWCGDSACNVPVLAQLFEGAGIELRVFRGSEKEDLKAMYENDGDDHIPVVSLWDSEGKELGRWIEAPQAMQEKKETWKAEHPNFEELYQRQKEGDKEAAKEFGTLYRQFLEEMASWYENGVWNETVREIVQLPGSASATATQ